MCYLLFVGPCKELQKSQQKNITKLCTNKTLLSIVTSETWGVEGRQHTMSKNNLSVDVGILLHNSVILINVV